MPDLLYARPDGLRTPQRTQEKAMTDVTLKGKTDNRRPFFGYATSGKVFLVLDI